MYFYICMKNWILQIAQVPHLKAQSLLDKARRLVGGKI